MLRTMISYLRLVAILMTCCSLSLCNAFSTSTTSTTTSTQYNHQNTALSALPSNNNNECMMSRRTSLIWTAAAVVLTTLPPLPANAAKQVDPALKGTKKDPSYEACVSQCMYDCTKPKGSEQKSRQECLPDCKKQCATTKQQLMTGTPISST